VKQSRAAFAKSVFEEEAAAFEKLQGLGGTIVPEFYGKYKHSFPDRELDDDKTVYVLLVGRVEGLPLSKIPVLEWQSDIARGMVISRIITAVSQINERGVFIPNGPDGRICINKYTSGVSINNFLFWAAEEKCTREKQKERLLEWFEDEEYDTFIDDEFWKPYS
jgi:hypothetical protein